MPWDGGQKVWHDTAYVLDRTNGTWRSAFSLPRPLAYGVSVTTDEGVVCIGGSDNREHHREVFLLRWRRGTLEHTPLAPLPIPLANACGARVGRTIYVAGGTETPAATHALKRFLALDLANPDAGWEERPAWPGPARMLAVAASLDGDFYLVGGTDLSPDAGGRPVRTYLKDAYRFRPGTGWVRVADPPNPVVAAPTPAPVIAPGTFLVIGGDDGTLANFEPKSRHPGFPRRLLQYDASGDAWSVAGSTPASRATLPVVTWQGLFVLPSGESRPGVRSPEVWAVHPASNQ
jgi:N-acetylneuraminic acid mutarotase